MNSKRLIFIMLSLAFTFGVKAQDSIVAPRDFSVVKDERVDLLGKKMAEYNESLANKIQMVRGYRLMLLNTTDRALAMQVRSNLLQQYPDQKVYMTFLSPYIKIKFGNFLDKEEADKVRKQLIASKVVTGNVYLLPEMVEQKPEKQNASEEGN
jgi:hypothetical protein